MENRMIKRMIERMMRKLIYGISALIAMMSFAACNGNSQTAATTATTVSGYYLSNGTCYASGTTTVVATSYCTTTTTTTSGQVCLGTYYQPGYGWGVCNSANCHGVYLYNSSGQLVYCQ
jgi:hypothetical protein